MQYHYVYENYVEGKIDIIKVESENNIADILTKALGKAQYVKLRGKLKLC